ncbi:GAF domain-containing protein [Nordella sp. HKS 07]|nr:GAF domain-containing protein [Nordella sp. HKS 07]
MRRTDNDTGGGFLRHLNIGRKLTVGFGLLVLLTLLVTGLNYIGSLRAVNHINLTTDLRAPSALASAQAQANLLRMLGEVRGYLALGDQTYREGYRVARIAFEADLAELDQIIQANRLSNASLISPTVLESVAELKASVAKWQNLPDQLFALRDDQLRREPALKILVVQGTPLIAATVATTNSMMNAQRRREPTAANTSLLADLAAFQSSFYAMVAGLRGYVTTKRDPFKFEYQSNISINDAAWANLLRQQQQLDTSQQTLLASLKRSREKFLLLPPQMFAAVEGEHAQEDLYLFRAQAVPLAENMLALLTKIADEEQRLLQSDLDAGRGQLLFSQRTILVGGVTAVLLGMALAYVFRNNIAGPIRRLTSVAERIGAGDLSARADVESEDEIGHLAETFNSMTVQLSDSVTNLERRRREQEGLAKRFRRQSEYLGALHDTGLGLVSRLDVTELLADLVSRAGKLLGTRNGFVYLADEAGTRLERRVGVGVYADSIGQKLDRNEGVAGRVWASGQALVINDYDRWEGRPAAAAALGLTIRSCMGVPLTSGGDTIGVLGMAYDSSSDLQFGQEEVELLSRFAQLASISLDNARLYAASQHSKQRAEEASSLVGEQNKVLQSLSTKLSKYLSPQVYTSIFTGRQNVEISSKRKKLTVFFSDIADFTATTDALESEELTGLLNRYLTEMSAIALSHGATIDKYVGDAILAFFGDPETKGVKEDALACVQMAIAMQRRMIELRAEWLDVGLEKPFQLRIGINTGFCTVGNFGSETRMDYTIIGNEVNLASRLQSHAELGGILISHETYSLVKEEVIAEELRPINAKGFADPVRTYSVRSVDFAAVDENRTIQHRREGIRIEVELDKLSGKSRQKAIEMVEKVLARLRA